MRIVLMHPETGKPEAEIFPRNDNHTKWAVDWYATESRRSDSNVYTLEQWIGKGWVLEKKSEDNPAYEMYELRSDIPQPNGFYGYLVPTDKDGMWKPQWAPGTGNMTSKSATLKRWVALGWNLIPITKEEASDDEAQRQVDD